MKEHVQYTCKTFRVHAWHDIVQKMVDIINPGSDVFIKVIETKSICSVTITLVYEFRSNIRSDDYIDFFFIFPGPVLNVNSNLVYLIKSKYSTF